MHEGRRIFQRLYQVWLDSIPEKGSHSAAHSQIPTEDRRSVKTVGHKNIAQPLLEIHQIGGKAE